ncbi:hypothetical protein IE81DRAFT_349565 [Ceraceosorus guamensis]|uniref:Uncharacterized protein n=1 Tax=Ceraceosorus guamensis TaxID=1522189 RepID=A0A316VUY1_9BASI|nr:hypothetical protein IE81DRAFT_349565 [Ceraceosorus guamensis]PWN40091.1 hypothetical protein IE81DRAFT_349565 [Ceraceosorus guamensis]
MLRSSEDVLVKYHFLAVLTAHEGVLKYLPDYNKDWNLLMYLSNAVFCAAEELQDRQLLEGLVRESGVAAFISQTCNCLKKLFLVQGFIFWQAQDKETDNSNDSNNNDNHPGAPDDEHHAHHVDDLNDPEEPEVTRVCKDEDNTAEEDSEVEGDEDYVDPTNKFSSLPTPKDGSNLKRQCAAPVVEEDEAGSLSDLSDIPPASSPGHGHCVVNICALPHPLRAKQEPASIRQHCHPVHLLHTRRAVLCLSATVPGLASGPSVAPVGPLPVSTLPASTLPVPASPWPISYSQQGPKDVNIAEIIEKCFGSGHNIIFGVSKARGAAAGLDIKTHPTFATTGRRLVRAFLAKSSIDLLNAVPIVLIIGSAALVTVPSLEIPHTSLDDIDDSDNDNPNEHPMIAHQRNSIARMFAVAAHLAVNSSPSLIRPLLDCWPTASTLTSISVSCPVVHKSKKTFALLFGRNDVVLRMPLTAGAITSSLQHVYLTLGLKSDKKYLSGTGPVPLADNHKRSSDQMSRRAVVGAPAQ